MSEDSKDFTWANRRAITVEQKRDILSRILLAWELSPSLRLGQLLVNALRAHLVRQGEESGSDELLRQRLFFMEDEDLVRLMGSWKSWIEIPLPGSEAHGEDPAPRTRAARHGWQPTTGDQVIYAIDGNVYTAVEVRGGESGYQARLDPPCADGEWIDGDCLIPGGTA